MGFRLSSFLVQGSLNEIKLVCSNVDGQEMFSFDEGQLIGTYFI